VVGAERTAALTLSYQNWGYFLCYELQLTQTMAKTPLHVIAKRPNTFGMKDKEREKRKRILKMCVQKLRDIDDPETVLCRAVLINNTFKTLKYAQRRLLKKSEVKRRAVHETAYDNEADIEGDENSTSDEEVTVKKPDDSVTSLSEANVPSCQNSFENSDIDELTSHCDINSYNAESIVHSLAMPPLLSPQIEDMTNCSFYDSFGSELSHSESSHEKEKHDASFDLDNNDVATSIKLTVMKTDLCDVVSESNRNNCETTQSFDFCQKSEFQSCVPNEIGNSLLIDNLLTEIGQA